MNKKTSSALKYLLGVAFGVVLLYFTFKNISWSEMMEAILETKFSWLFLSMAVALFSHYLRGLRWRMQLRASGYSPSSLHTFAAVMVAYLVNIPIPRGGELARCSALLKSDKVPLATGFGTVVVERVIDAFVLLGLIVLAFVLESQAIYNFMEESLGSGGEESSGVPLIVWLAGGAAFLAVTAFALRERLMKIPLVQKAFDFVKELLQSALSIRKIENPGLYIFYTILMWVCYWQMTYVAFFSMDAFANLEINLLYFALVVTIIGGIGMAFPSPGGIGSYHFAVGFTFAALGILGTTEESTQFGVTFATILHSAQLLLMIVFGALGYLLLWLKPSSDSAMQADVDLTSLETH